MTKLVRDLMHPGVLTCQPDASLGQVAVLLAQHHVHALIVSDRDGRPLGIISDYDLLAGEWLSVDAESLDAMRKLTAADLMSYPVDTIEADMTLKDAAHKLDRRRCQPLAGHRKWNSGWRHFYLRFCCQYSERREAPTRDRCGRHGGCNPGLPRKNAHHLGCAVHDGSRLEVRTCG